MPSHMLDCRSFSTCNWIVLQMSRHLKVHKVVYKPNSIAIFNPKAAR